MFIVRKIIKESMVFPTDPMIVLVRKISNESAVIHCATINECRISVPAFRGSLRRVAEYCNDNRPKSASIVR
jgi:hypothetical protein